MSKFWGCLGGGGEEGGGQAYWSNKIPTLSTTNLLNSHSVAQGGGGRDRRRTFLIRWPPCFVPNLCQPSWFSSLFVQLPPISTFVNILQQSSISLHAKQQQMSIHALFAALKKMALVKISESNYTQKNKGPTRDYQNRTSIWKYSFNLQFFI